MNYEIIQQLSEKIKAESGFVQTYYSECSKAVIGQRKMLEGILLGLLADGHILLEGVPGLAKTKTVSTVAATLGCGFKRIQFTPDLLPADIMGTEIYNPKTGEFSPKQGPVFTNILLADEVNRAPAKVQSALLEAMQERQVTIGESTYPLPTPFLVMATQNPLEQEGTYPLPEAQIDRFMFKILVDYPTRDEEKQVLDMMSGGGEPPIQPVIDLQQILEARKLIREIYIDDKIKDYILSLVSATRNPELAGIKTLAGLIQIGASPRASIYLALAAKANAFVQGRGYVTPEDVKAIVFNVLRHRIILTYEAEAEEMSPETVLQQILDRVEVP